MKGNTNLILKIFAPGGKVEKNSKKKTALRSVLLKKMDPQKGSGGEGKKKKAPSSLFEGKHLSLWARLLNQQLKCLSPSPPKIIK